MKYLIMLISLAILVGCQGFSTVQIEKQYQREYVVPEQDFVISATGYAPIDAQQGKDSAERIIKAIKASKMDAYRDLSEKVHGYKLSSNVQVSDLILGDENMKASVQGVIKGARLVKSYHLDGVYITELELNLKDLYTIRAFTDGQSRIIDARYY